MGFPQPSFRQIGLDLRDPGMILTILDHMPTPAIVIDWPSRRIVHANAAAVGTAQDTTPLEGRRLSESLPLWGGVCGDRLDGVGRTGRRENWRAVPNGMGVRWWDIACSPLTDDSGAVVGLLLTAQDVTDRERLAAAQVEQAAALREINHRVKNTLQLISSLLTLQTLSTLNTEMRRALQDSCGRIGIISQLYQRITQGQYGAVVDFSRYLGDMANDVSAAGRGCPLMVACDDTVLPVETAVPLALIVNELVNNAARHAYPSGEVGAVAVTLRRRPEGGLQLVVSDQGQGVPPGFDLARQAGMGLKMARAFTAQLKGHLRLDDSGAGSVFIVDLPG